MDERDRPFATLLRRYREAAGLTQEDLAEMAGLTAKGIGALERGERQRPYPHTVQRLAEALHLGDEEQRIFRGAARGQAPAPSAPAPIASLPTLPLPLTPLVGRGDELAALCHLLESRAARLITLTGPGGVGKTRLAFAVAAEVSARSATAVVPVLLAAVRDPALVAPTIAGTLGLREEGRQSLVERLAAHLREKPMLLVLDNFEQVIDAAPLVADLLAACPGVTFLVTSRAPLRISGEQEVAVRPLALPDQVSVRHENLLAQSPAIALFVQRARAVKPEFALTAANAPAVAEICRRLDGLPLALELAAARIKVLPPQALLTRLSGASGHTSLQILTGGARDLPARLQTMRSAIAWSYDLLSRAEQAIFRCMAVFDGGCRLETLEEICRAVALPEGQADVLELLASLVDKSLAQVDEPPDGEPRFTLLETIRDYGWECLEAQGELPAVQRRHAVYVQALVETVGPALTGPNQAACLAHLENEHGNLRAALRWALENEETAIGLRLAAALWRFWQMRGYLTEGRAWLNAVLALPWETMQEAALIAARSQVLNGLGVLCDIQGDQRSAIASFEQSLALRRQLGDRRGIADSLTNLGIVAVYQGNYQRAAALYQESLAIRRETADTTGMAATLNNLGIVARYHGEYERASALFEEGLALQRQMDNKRGIALALNNLATVAQGQGDLTRADDLAHSSLILFEELGDTWGLVLALYNQASAARDQGDLARAAALFRQSLSHFGDVGPTAAILEGLEGVAGVICAQGHPDHAALLLGAAAAQRENLELPLPPADRGAYERTLTAVQSALEDSVFTARWQDGRSLSLDQAIALVGSAP